MELSIVNKFAIIVVNKLEKLMKDESILMKKVTIDGNDFYFGHLLFSIDYIGKVKHTWFKSINEQLEFLKYVSLTVSAVTPNKQQKMACQSLWDMINKERKKDVRITKEILKVWPDGLGENIFNYYERKERKFVPKKTIKTPKSFLLNLCALLKFFKYKITDDEYVKIRENIYIALLENFKKTSEYGLVPVINQSTIGLVKCFYPYFPEIINLPYSEQCTAKNLFNVLIELWKISHKVEFLKELDINFNILKNSENVSVVSQFYETVIKIVREKPELESYIPKIAGFKKVDSNIDLREASIYFFTVDVEVLQKIMMQSSLAIHNKKLTPEICENNLKILMSYELESLEIIKPLRKIYISKDKREIEFVFNINYIDNIETFKSYWKRVIVEMLLSEDNDNRVLKVEILNEEYEMRKNLVRSTVKKKILKY